MLARLQEPLLACLQYEAVTALIEARTVEIHRDLHARGLALVWPQSAPSMLAASLGEVLDVTEVRLRPDARTYLTSPKAIPAHTDHPDARYILWFCNQNDATTGESLLFDGHELVKRMSEVQQTALALATLSCPDLKRAAPMQYRRVWNPEQQSLFFAPWLPRSRRCAQVIEDFAVQLAGALPTHCIRLRPGQALIVDNHRMLHGRAPLLADSTRWLTRFWIAGERDGQPTLNGRLRGPKRGQQ